MLNISDVYCICTPSECLVVCVARRLVKKCLLFVVVMLRHPEITESFGDNYLFRVLGLLDIVPRVIMPQHSTQSQGVLCHGHSPGYVNH